MCLVFNRISVVAKLISCLKFISAEFAKLPYIAPYLQPGYNQFTDGANFASAGAGALAETNKPGNVLNL